MKTNKSRQQPRKRIRGGQKDNKNARRPKLKWLKYELDTDANIDLFIRDIIRVTWEDKLDTRKASALNGSVRLLMEKRGLIQKSNLNITQSQNDQNEDEIISNFILDLPSELQRGIMVYVQKENKAGNPSESRGYDNSN